MPHFPTLHLPHFWSRLTATCRPSSPHYTFHHCRCFPARVSSFTRKATAFCFPVPGPSSTHTICNRARARCTAVVSGARALTTPPRYRILVKQATRSGAARARQPRPAETARVGAGTRRASSTPHSPRRRALCSPSRAAVAPCISSIGRAAQGRLSAR